MLQKILAIKDIITGTENKTWITEAAAEIVREKTALALILKQITYLNHPNWSSGGAMWDGDEWDHEHDKTNAMIEVFNAMLKVDEFNQPLALEYDEDEDKMKLA